MPPSAGFGRSRFGHGPFGEADFAHNVFWLGVPSTYRENDTSGYFETLLRSYGEVFDRVRHKIRDLPSLRDPLKVRTRYNEQVTLTLLSSDVTSAEDSADGKAFITFVVSNASIPDMDPIGPSWVMEATERNYFVRQISKVDGTFSVYGDDVPVGLSQVLRPPSIIEYLGRDFDINIDGHEPEGFQRGLITDVVKWYDLKGTEKGIRLRANLAGFSCTIRSLWAIDPEYAPLIPASNLFELEAGVFHTDIEPGFLQFDDIPADIVPTDTVCSLTPVTFPITVTAVTVIGDQFRLTTTTPLDMIGNETGPWKVTLGSDEFIVESFNVGLGYLYVAGSITPVAGAYTLEYDCQPVVTCGWCKSYKILLDLTPTNDELLTNPVALDGAFDRLIAKIEAILPAHVQAMYALVTTGGAVLEVIVGGASETYVFGNFDDIPADDQPTDTPITIIPA